MTVSVKSNSADGELQVNGATAVPFNAGGTTSKILPITATVAASALTCTLKPTVLDFRSPTLTTGIPNTRLLNADATLTVPNTATLGCLSTATANYTTDRLILLAIDNAGTVELAIVNLAGGNNLDETTLISTTVLNTGATAKNVAYSTTARTSVPFRVVGYVELLAQATAGTWATAPTTVQGMGGQALAAMSSLGYGQTFTSNLLTGSVRVSGQTYYNTTGKPICVYIWTGGHASIGAGAYIYINGVTVMSFDGFGSGGGGMFIVPNGMSYRVDHYNTALVMWTELR